MPTNSATSTTMPLEVKVYLKSVMMEAGLDKADAILQDMMMDDLYERFQHHIILTFAKHLQDDEMETFSRLAALDYGHAITFVKEKKPEMSEILLTAMGEFRSIFLKQKQT